MKVYLLRLSLILVLVLALISVKSNARSDWNHDENKLTSKQSPILHTLVKNDNANYNLKLIVDDTIIDTYPSTYNWSYNDPVTGETYNINADSVAPTEILKDKPVYDVADVEHIKLQFFEEPEHFYVQVLQPLDNELNTPFQQFKHFNKKGEFIFHIVGMWEQGTRTYVVRLNIL